MSTEALDVRAGLQRVATHVLARARFVETGRFGLRILPGGFGTPMLGAAEVVLRVSGTTILREWRDDDGGHSATLALHDATLRSVAAFAQVDLAAAFSAGPDTAPVGDVDEPMSFDDRVAASLAQWSHAGVRPMQRRHLGRRLILRGTLCVRRSLG